MSTISRSDSPYLRKKASIFSLQSSNVTESKSQSKMGGQIQGIISRFNRANEQIQVETDHSNFNLITYGKQDSKVKYDSQLLVAKLRSIENKTQMKKAQIQIDRREEKFFLSLKKKKKMEKLYKYSDVYEKYKKGRNIEELGDEYSDDESDMNERGPKGVSYFHNLRKHPKLLEYTLKRLKEKESEKVEKLEKLKNIQAKIKENSEEINPQFQQIASEMESKNKAKRTNSELIIESRMSKILSRNSSGNLKKSIEESPRCHKIIEQQNKMLNQIDEKSLSKSGKKKLKAKLNEIVVGISKSERTRSFILPKIKSK